MALAVGALQLVTGAEGRRLYSALASYHVYLEYPILALLAAGLVAGLPKGPRMTAVLTDMASAVAGLEVLADAAPQPSSSTNGALIVAIVVAVVVAIVAVAYLVARRRR